MRLRTWLGATLAVPVLLLTGATGCGGAADAGDAAPGASGGDKGGGASSTSGSDACSLLEVAEIEAAFGDRGAVAGGEPLGFSCSWAVGEGAIGVTRARGAGMPADSMAEIRDLALDPVEVDGLGDEAFFDGPMLWFRSGATTFSVTAAFLGDMDMPAVQAKLTGLAHRMLERA